MPLCFLLIKLFKMWHALCRKQRQSMIETGQNLITEKKILNTTNISLFQEKLQLRKVYNESITFVPIAVFWYILMRKRNVFTYGIISQNQRYSKNHADKYILTRTSDDVSPRTEATVKSEYTRSQLQCKPLNINKLRALFNSEQSSLRSYHRYRQQQCLFQRSASPLQRQVDFNVVIAIFIKEW